jgi:hypothetical protein
VFHCFALALIQFELLAVLACRADPRCLTKQRKL